MLYMFVLLIPFFLIARNVSDQKIEITINNIDTTRAGNLIVLIFQDKGFPKKHETAITSRTIKVNKSTETVVFKLPEYPRELAFKVLHDEDENNKVSKNWTGIWPSEGLGFSNDQKISTFGPPSFKASKLTKNEYLNGVKINILYP